MISVGKTEVVGWEAAIRGMRNPMNSWEKSDSSFCTMDSHNKCYNPKERLLCNDCCVGDLAKLGPDDHALMMKLRNAGTDHRKFMRMITVHMDIVAPLYWWKEFDTYKVGTVANSCSTMHKIATKEFELDDFSYDHLLTEYDTTIAWGDWIPRNVLEHVILVLNRQRELYLKTRGKKYWWQMIQLLPSSYNQLRTVMLNYEVLANIYKSRKNHRLDEWRDFCKWIESLPYGELITGEENTDD